MTCTHTFPRSEWYCLRGCGKVVHGCHTDDHECISDVEIISAALPGLKVERLEDGEFKVTWNNIPNGAIFVSAKQAIKARKELVLKGGWG